MDRKQLYNEITSSNLQEEVKAVYGRNYTQCSNEQLKAIINKAATRLKSVKVKNNLAFDKLVAILAKKKILLKSEVEAIMNI